MNYRHAFHAGNHADVFKHAVLARLVDYLKRKDKPFRVIDTHAGRGAYNLRDAAAQRSPEWRDGIARLLSADLAADVSDLLEPYLSLARADVSAHRYPGSPDLIRRWLRSQDRLTAIELQPDDHLALAEHFTGDRQVRVLHLDGWFAMKGHLPPKERRGLVLVDPSFEVPGEYDRLVDHLIEAYKRFATGVFALWYPLKAGAPIAAFHARLATTHIPRLLIAELRTRADSDAPGLSGSGIVLVNPPYTLPDEVAVMLPALMGALAQGDGANWRCTWLNRE